MANVDYGVVDRMGRDRMAGIETFYVQLNRTAVNYDLEYENKRAYTCVSS